MRKPAAHTTTTTRPAPHAPQWCVLSGPATPPHVAASVVCRGLQGPQPCASACNCVAPFAEGLVAELLAAGALARRGGILHDV